MSTSFCLHVSLERNINFVHEISHVEYNAFRKFSGQNIFVRFMEEKFSHKLFGIEISVNKNKANYNRFVFVCVYVCVSYLSLTCLFLFSRVQSMRYEEEADVKPFVVVEVVHKVCVAVNVYYMLLDYCILRCKSSTLMREKLCQMNGATYIPCV